MLWLGERLWLLRGDDEAAERRDSVPGARRIPLPAYRVMNDYSCIPLMGDFIFNTRRADYTRVTYLLLLSKHYLYRNGFNFTV